MNKNEFTEDGTTYIAVDKDGCDGCVAQGDSLLCNNLPLCIDSSKKDWAPIIWKVKE